MGKADQKRQQKALALANADERRRVVLRVFQGCDDVGVSTLAELAKTGVTASCTAGCSHCCSQEIPMTRAEGEMLVAWLVENRTPEELDAIRARLRGWLAWYRTEYPQHLAAGLSRVDVFFRHAPKCALLEDDRCSAYRVRPVACRNHFVSSPASRCDPATGTGEIDEILAVSKASYDHVVEIRRVVERQGGNFMASVHMHAEWLVHLLDVEREPWLDAPD